MKGELLNEQELKKIFCNPFYCLNKVDDVFAKEHEPMITEEGFIQAGEILIKQIGVKEYLKLLLENLKGNYI